MLRINQLLTIYQGVHVTHFTFNIQNDETESNSRYSEWYKKWPLKLKTTKFKFEFKYKKCHDNFAPGIFIFEHRMSILDGTQKPIHFTMKI